MIKTLITGGGGFIGRAFCRRQLKDEVLGDWQITAMSRDEAKLVKVAKAYPDVRVIKGDVTDDIDYLARLFSGYDIIIHAAANKLVDIGEWSAFEVYKNNIVGSHNVAKAAMKAGVKRVVGISSDKAVQPVNTYGASKMMMERMFQEADRLSDTEFVCARYGNVVGSTISIVLYFQDQLKAEGKIKVTDPKMSRFYMSADEGIDTILHTLKHAERGSVVIPKMRAMTTARVATLVLGLGPMAAEDPEGIFTRVRTADDSEIKSRVEIIGARPGEKIHECLLHAQESVRIKGRVEDQTYLELRPPIEKGTCEVFTITSDNPPLGWMRGEYMMELIEDAKNI